MAPPLPRRCALDGAAQGPTDPFWACGTDAQETGPSCTLFPLTGASRSVKIDHYRPDCVRGVSPLAPVRFGLLRQPLPVRAISSTANLVSGSELPSEDEQRSKAVSRYFSAKLMCCSNLAFVSGAVTFEQSQCIRGDVVCADLV